jgi:hypothetical protein
MNFKLSAILLSIYLLFTQLGYGYVLHFCHDELSHVKSVYESTSINCCGDDASCCSFSHDNEADRCCENVTVTAEVDDNLIPQFDFDCQALYFSNCLSFDFKKFENKIEKPNYFLNSNPAHAPPLYVLYSQFIIYG